MKNKGNILVTGAAGMVGSHLIDYFKGQIPRENIIGSYHKPTIALNDIKDNCVPVMLDITDRQAVEKVIHEFKPAKIFHLAAQSLPTVAWEKPAETMNTNVNGTINVFESVSTLRKTHPAYNPIVIVACSGMEYGASITPENAPVKEDAPLLPLHPYGVSKVAQDLLAFQYFRNKAIRCIRARIFNATGPRKTNDAVSDFIARALSIKHGKEKTFRVGNLKTRRAITDVRDLVNALVLLSEKGKWGEAYNICGGKVYKMAEIIPVIEKQTGIKLKLEADKTLFRPSDEAVIYGDSTKLKKDTGWKQQYSLLQTIADMVKYMENRMLF